MGLIGKAPLGTISSTEKKKGTSCIYQNLAMNLFWWERWEIENCPHTWLSPSWLLRASSYFSF